MRLNIVTSTSTTCTPTTQLVITMHSYSSVYTCSSQFKLVLKFMVYKIVVVVTPVKGNAEMIHLFLQQNVRPVVGSTSVLDSQSY